VPRDADKQKDFVTFYCKDCKYKFAGKPDFVESAPAETGHPFLYFKKCPICREDSPQAYWERNLLKAWANSTGPKTEAGKAASAANLDGHPTPDEALLTRFNAMKHGLNADVATYYPASPGKYPECESCEFKDSICTDEVACLKKMDLFFKHHVAFDTKDPGKLMGLRANTQAAIQSIIDSMILIIAQDGGPRIKEPIWSRDNEGFVKLVQYFDIEQNEIVSLVEHKAHPLLKPLMDFLSKNKMTLEDIGMTPKMQEEQAILSGFIDNTQPASATALEDFRERTEESLSGMREMIERSQETTKNDSILIEHQESESNA
jgi:hypothetical protein